MEANVDLAAVMGEAKQLLKSGKPKRACALLREHRDAGWDNPRFLALNGAACCMAGQPEEGVKVFERALEIAPSATAHFNLGEAYQMAHHREKARSCFEHAITLDPGYTQAIHALEALAPKEEKPVSIAPDYPHIETTGEYEVSPHAHLLSSEDMDWDQKGAGPGGAPQQNPDAEGDAPPFHPSPRTADR